MRNFNYCIIDEVDSILVDEARTPLIISGPAEKPSDRYYKAAKIASAFERDIHYTVRLLHNKLHVIKVWNFYSALCSWFYFQLNSLVLLLQYISLTFRNIINFFCVLIYVC